MVAGNIDLVLVFVVFVDERVIVIIFVVVYIDNALCLAFIFVFVKITFSS